VTLLLSILLERKEKWYTNVGAPSLQAFKVRGFTDFAQSGKASTLATPFNDPIAQSIEEYQAFLKTLGYSPIAEAAYGKKVR
jgi:hypothetical protein